MICFGSNQSNNVVEKLNLEGNWIQEPGCVSVADMLAENIYLSDLVSYHCSSVIVVVVFLVIVITTIIIIIVIIIIMSSFVTFYAKTT